MSTRMQSRNRVPWPHGAIVPWCIGTCWKLSTIKAAWRRREMERSKHTSSSSSRKSFSMGGPIVSSRTPPCVLLFRPFFIFSTVSIDDRQPVNFTTSGTFDFLGRTIDLDDAFTDLPRRTFRTAISIVWAELLSVGDFSGENRSCLERGSSTSVSVKRDLARRDLDKVFWYFVRHASQSVCVQRTSLNFPPLLMFLSFFLSFFFFLFFFGYFNTWARGILFSKATVSRVRTWNLTEREFTLNLF